MQFKQEWILIMSRAFLTIYHNYTPPYKTEYYKLFYEYFIENLPKWHDLVDTIYIVDDKWHFTQEEKQRAWDIKKEVIFWENDIQGHFNEQFKKFFPLIKEDQILHFDNDAFIYDRKGIQTWFDQIGDYDYLAPVQKIVVSDSLQEAIWSKYPKMKTLNANTFEGNQFIITKRFFEWAGEIDYNEYNPFSEGFYIPELDYTTKKGEYGEYACRYYYKIMQRDNWKEMLIVANQGFHHLHSMSWAYLLLSKKATGDVKEYWEFIKSQPIEKSLKIMNWFLTIDVKGKYTDEIKSVIQDVLFNKIHSFQ
mgnify:FL=1